MARILTLIFLTVLSPVLVANPMYPEVITKITKTYGCYLDDSHNNKNEAGTKKPYFWGVVRGADQQSSVVFWCIQKVDGKLQNKLVIHVDKTATEQFRKEAVFSSCPNQITNIKGHSTGVWIENNAIYTGFEDGIYYYCKDGKWSESSWH